MESQDFEFQMKIRGFCGLSAGHVLRVVHRGGVSFTGHYGAVCGG